MNIEKTTKTIREFMWQIGLRSSSGREDIEKDISEVLKKHFKYQFSDKNKRSIEGAIETKEDVKNDLHFSFQEPCSDCPYPASRHCCDDIGNPIEEGAKCPSCNEGVFEFVPDGVCTCHIVPPCSACVNSYLKCNKCGFNIRDEE